MRILSCLAMLVTIGVIAPGCSQKSANENSSPSVATTLVSASSYVLAEEPEEPIGVIEAREQAKNGDEITLVARVGGRRNPWMEGRAAFMVIDASMAVVADGTESGKNQICLDDCCAALRGECTTMVKFVDAKGSVLAADSRNLFQINADDMVVVRGRVQRDKEQGTFVIVADGIYVRR